MTRTYTVSNLAVPDDVFEAIVHRLLRAGYDYKFNHDSSGKLASIDMTGIALVREDKEKKP